MPPTLRLSVPAAESYIDTHRNDYGSHSSESDSDGESYVSDDDQSDQVRSPTRLVYNLDALPEKTKSTVRDTFNEPPAMVVQHCRQVGDTFAFQMSEVVTRSVRIRAPTSGEARMSCSCAQGAREDDREPCSHILWLLDQLVNQTLYRPNHDAPLTMTSAGYPKEMGDPFEAISEHHLNIVADGLHCRHVDPDCYDPRQADQHRVAESRDLLSSVHQAETDSFRPDIFDSPLLGPPMVKPHDLDYTVFRMLVDDDLFFHYFLAETTRGSTVLQQLRLLTHRINAVLDDFDAHNAGVCSDAPNSPPGTHSVAWAARHIEGVVSLVRYAAWSGKRPLTAAEQEAAAGTLVHILDGVARRHREVRAGGRRPDRSLFLRFLGDVDRGFVLDELERMPDGARRFTHHLERIVNAMAGMDAAPTYVVRFRKFIAQLKMSEAPRLKRENSDSDDDEGAFKRRG